MCRLHLLGIFPDHLHLFVLISFGKESDVDNSNFVLFIAFRSNLYFMIIIF